MNDKEIEEILNKYNNLPEHDLYSLLSLIHPNDTETIFEYYYTFVKKEN